MTSNPDRRSYLATVCKGLRDRGETSAAGIIEDLDKELSAAEDKNAALLSALLSAAQLGGTLAGELVSRIK